MKYNRLFTIALSFVVATAAMAERADKPTPEERGKADYSSWLPQKGDFSVAFSLDPVATFAGNLFANGEGRVNSLSNLAGEPLLSEQIEDRLGRPMASIMGAYMLTDQLGIKANIGFGYSTKKTNYYVIDDAAQYDDPWSTAQVTDSKRYSNITGSIAIGAEYRVGKRLPVQGVFGGGVNYMFGTVKHTYHYGNAITELNQHPSQNAEMPAWVEAPTFASSKYLSARVLSETQADLIHMVGLYGSVGIEWFVAPKIALGANVNLALYYEIVPSRATKYEGWNHITEQAEDYTELVSPASNGFHFGTDNIGANLYLNFYF